MDVPISRIGHVESGLQRQIVSVALTVLLMAALSSCATGSNHLPAFTWQGDHIRFSTSVGRLPCGDSLAYMDQHVGELIDSLNEPWPPGEKINYFWLPGSMELSPCPANSDCADRTSVYSRTMFHDHEIVHVLLRKLGRSQTFVYEGMAEAFGRAGGRLTISREQARLEILRSLEAKVDPATINYPLAGLFIRFLIEIYGLDSVKRVYARTRYDTTIDDLRSIFEDECSIGLSDALDRLFEEGKDCYPRINLCAATPISWNGEIWNNNFGLACTSPGVLEIIPGALRNEALIEIDQPGFYTVNVSRATEPIEPIVILKCSCEAESQTVEAGSEKSLALEKGRYRVLVGRMADDLVKDPGLLQVSIRASDKNAQ